MELKTLSGDVGSHTYMNNGDGYYSVIHQSSTSETYLTGIFVSDKPGVFNQLSSTGVSPLWVYDGHSSTIADITVTDSGLYTASHDGRVKSIDKDSGNKIWSYSPYDPPSGSARSLAIKDDVLYAGGFAGGGIMSLDKNTGVKIWQNENVESADDLDVYGDVLYASSNDGLKAVDIYTGNILWTIDGRMIGSTVEDGIIYTAEQDDDAIHQSDKMMIRAYDIDARSQIWEYDGHDGTIKGLSVSNGILYSSSYDETVKALNVQDGSLKWIYNGHDNRVFPVYASKGVVYSGSGEWENFGVIKAINAEDKSLLWEFNEHNNDMRSVIEYNGIMYSGDADGVLIATELIIDTD